MTPTTTASPTTTAVMYDSPVGPLLLEGDDRVLRLIELPRPRRGAAPPSAADVRLPAALADTVRQLGQYFAGRRREFDLPVELSGTEFQRSVWTSLADIPYGQVISYAELAEMVGRPTAFRAVGQANGANPIPIVLPCHRVVASGGGIGGYGGGLDLKRELLALEGVTGYEA